MRWICFKNYDIIVIILDHKPKRPGNIQLIDIVVLLCPFVQDTLMEISHNGMIFDKT